MISEIFFAFPLNMCRVKEVKLLPNCISRNLAKIMLCLRDMNNLEEIFERS